MSQDGRQDSHDCEGSKGSRKDNHAIVFHGHEGGYQKGLVANFGNQDHGKG
jgi:hypothetical protein